MDRREHDFHPVDRRSFTIDRTLQRHGIADLEDPDWRIRLTHNESEGDIRQAISQALAETGRAEHPKVDLTRMDTPENEALMRAYNVQGVPTVIFLDASGRERPDTRVLGYMPPEAFLERAGL